ncbi:MAG: LppX_LprAFG lipoprotein [Actinobacteria bacterium]|nr:LppX_LprAFG lipoprotein [Actinomycetota bacterium]
MLMRRRLVTAAVLPLLALGACSSDGGGAGGDDDAAPADVLAAAKTALDDTSGVHITLSTDDLPDGIDGLISADGDGTHAPAFDGTIKVRYSGLEPTVPVIAVDGVVYAQVPLTTGWSEIDPSEYGAPDPAQLLSTDAGFTSLLPATEDPVAGEQVRGGENNAEVLTEYTGTVAGDTVANIIPTASGEFDATYTITDGDELREMVLTGDFYGEGSSMTYTITFDDYGSEPDISAP